MVRPDVAARKIARASAWLDDAEAILSRPVEELAAAAKDRDLAAFYLFLAIQESVDLAAHWVADAGWMVPDDAASTFDVLADRAAIDRGLATSLRLATGLRNRIGHGYALLDHRRLHAESQEGIPALREFLTAVATTAGL